MAKDPAFLFYPGDYLRDTQCLSEAVQVAYDRIMCEHMRNICITQAQLKFFTKKLKPEEVDELKHVLTKVDGGYQIEWVVASITKRKAYSVSRAENRAKHMNNICKTYDEHMVNENEIVISSNWEKEKNNFLKDEGWIYKVCTSKNIALLEIRPMMANFINDLELKEEYKSRKELQSHFVNLLNKNKTSGTIKSKNSFV